jgi:hypothetical protein
VPSDVTFSGNELFVYVESLSFNTSTFARIDLNVVPLPAAGLLFPASLACLGYLDRRRKATVPGA